MNTVTTLSLEAWVAACAVTTIGIVCVAVDVDNLAFSLIVHPCSGGTSGANTFKPRGAVRVSQLKVPVFNTGWANQDVADITASASSVLRIIAIAEGINGSADTVLSKIVIL